MAACPKSLILNGWFLVSRPPPEAGWFLLSFWGAEDGPISHHGGAHSFDLTGACHAHLLHVSGKSLLPLGDGSEGPDEPRFFGFSRGVYEHA